MPWFRDTYRDAVWDCESLRPNEKLIALVYADHAGDPKKPRNDVAWVSWPRLSARTGIRSKSALNKAMDGLRAAGWLVKIEERKQHRSPRYRLVIPTNPEVRETHVWDGPEVAETNHSPVDNQPSEVVETDVWTPSEVAEMDHREGPEVAETTPEVAETTLRGSRGEPDPSNYPSTTDKPPSLDTNHKTRETKPTCHCRRFTIDGDCLDCGRYEPCPDCRRLARIGPELRCYRHQEAS